MRSGYNHFYIRRFSSKCKRSRGQHCVSTVDVEATPTSVSSHSVTIDYDATTLIATVSTEETTAFDGVLLVAQYNSGGVLQKAQPYDLTEVSSENDVETEVGILNNGDKLFVWDSLNGMVPYGTAMVSGTDNVQPTVGPAPTAAPKATTVAGTDIPTATTTTDTDIPTSTSKATTAPTATPAVCKVTGTVDIGVNAISLTAADGTEIKGTISDDTNDDGTRNVTFKDVYAGVEYTVTTTPGDDYKDPVAKIEGYDSENTFTFPAEDVSDLTVTT
jgi:hypothetical protein